MAEMKMVYTPCQGWGCHEHCILSTYIDENGVIDHMERMELPEEIANDKDPYRLESRACICAKGALAGKIPYMKERITHPLKRVGERGEGKFEEISWEQALDEITAKLKEIIDKHGPQAVLMNDFPCGYAGYPNCLGYSMQYRFRHVFGFSQLEMEAADEAVIKAPAMFFGDDVRSSICDTQLLANADNLLIWGGNPYGWSRAGHTTRTITGLREKGVKITAIAAMYEATAAKADVALLVKPATDIYLAFAMANYIIKNGYVNEDYIIRRTIAPFLVRADTGKFLHPCDIEDGGSEVDYVYWDAAAGAPAYKEPEGVGATGDDVGHTDWTGSTAVFGGENSGALEGEPDLMAKQVIAGIQCQTAYSLLVEQLEPYTFEYQETLTGVPADQAETAIYDFVTHPNSTIWLGAGLRYLNSVQTARAINLIPTLTGHLESSDAAGINLEGTYDNYPVQFADSTMIFAGYEPVWPRMIPMQKALDSFQDPDVQQYKAFFNLYSNYVHNWPPRELWEKRFFPNMDLIVVDEIRMTETAMFADYVLPDRTIFERPTIVVQGGYLIYCEPAIEPIGEARELAGVLMELGRRLGRPDAFEGTVEEWEDRRLTWSTDPAILSVEPPITIERLKKEKIIKINDAGRCYNPYRETNFGTRSGRAEFYIDVLAGIPGGPLTDHIPALIDDEERRKKYPLHLFCGRSRFFMQGQFREIAELRKLAGNGPRVGMNKHDAVARGIKEGDIVEITNERGTVKVPCHFTNAIPQGMAYLWYAFGVKDYTMSGPATILGANSGIDEAVEPVCAAFGPYWRERRLELGYPDTMMLNVGEYGTETIWDVLCEIKGAE